MQAIEIANLAPSVGLLKPTRFCLISSLENKIRVKENFEKTNKKALSEQKSENQEKIYSNLKLEGILEAPVGLVICCDFSVLDGFSIGTISQPREMLLASTSCAIHTLWLCLTEKKLGLGWVSILDFEELAKDLELPKDWFPMGYFCIGKPATDYEKMPMLALENWKEDKESAIILKR